MLKYRKDIDGLRALAVIPIVLGHAGISGFSGGFVGVDIFFVISGFLIAGILQRELLDGKFSLIGFYGRRVRRILPALFAMLLICLIVAIRVLPPDMFVDLSRSTLATILFASNIWFFHTSSDYFAADADLNPLLHTWSLGVEEQFYILFPVLLWWLWSRPNKIRRMTIAGMTLISFIVSVWATQTYPLANFYLLPMRAWELGLGILLAMGFIPKINKRIWSEIAAWFGFLAILYSVIFYNEATAFPGIAALLPCAGAALLIWTGGQHKTGIGRLLSLPVFVGIGLISYSLYLWHWPIFVFFRLKTGTADLSLNIAVIGIALSLIFAVVSWRFVERPFRKRYSIRMSRKSVFSMATVSAVILAGGAGLIHMKEGFPGRVPEDIRAIYAASDDMNPDRPQCINKTPAQGLCELAVQTNPLDKRDVLLWGDSHAGAVMPGVNMLLEDKNMSGLIAFKGACPPILGLERADKGKKSKQCTSFNQAVMDMLRDRDDLGVVILVARWSIAAEGTRILGEAKKPAIFRRVNHVGPDFDPAGNFDAFSETFSETVQAIRATGRQVIILEGIPEHGRPVPLSLGNARFIGAAQPARPNRAFMEDRNIRANQVLRGAAEDINVHFAETISFMCKPDCIIDNEGIPLYRDDDHLSFYGSKYLIPSILEPSLRAAENQAP